MLLVIFIHYPNPDDNYNIDNSHYIINFIWIHPSQKEETHMESHPYIDKDKEYLEYVRDHADPNSIDRRNAIAELEYRASQELLRKIHSDINKLTIPHWTRNWTFYLVVVSIVIALVALALQWTSYIRDSKSSGLSVPGLSQPTMQLPSSSPVSTQKKQISQSKPVQKKP